MKLTELVCRQAPQKEKLYRMSDGDWLYLEVPPKGNKRWIIRYRFNGKDNCLALGRYPRVNLKEARELRDRQQEIHAKGISPGQRRKIEKVENISNTFESIADEWFKIRENEWTDTYKKIVLRTLRIHLHPYIGQKAIKQITPNDLLKMLSKPESKGHHITAARALHYVSKIFKFGIRRGFVEYDISAGLKEDLVTPKRKHMPSITDPKKVGRLLRDIDTYRGGPTVCAALRLLPLTFVRPSEMSGGEWQEINWEEKTWSIEARKMKMRKDHIVPLSNQALKILLDIHPRLHDVNLQVDDIRNGWDEILQKWHLQQTENQKYIFPNTRHPGKPMSSNSTNGALVKLGYKNRHCSHGFRSTARTLLDEELEFNPSWIEMQLAHRVRGPLGDTYNRAKYLKQRKQMMRAWADYLDDLKAKEVAEVE